MNEEDVVEDVFIKLAPDSRRRNAPTLRKGAPGLDALLGLAAAGVPQAPSGSGASAARPAQLSAHVPAERHTPPSAPRDVAFELEAVDPRPQRASPRIGPPAQLGVAAPPSPARRAPIGVAVVAVVVVTAAAVLALWLL